MKILAIDPGKSKMVGCTYDTETHEHRFDSVALDRGSLGIVLEVERPDRVVIEVSSSAARCQGLDPEWFVGPAGQGMFVGRNRLRESVAR